MQALPRIEVRLAALSVEAQMQILKNQVTILATLGRIMAHTGESMTSVAIDQTIDENTNFAKYLERVFNGLAIPK